MQTLNFPILRLFLAASLLVMSACDRGPTEPLSVSGVDFRMPAGRSAMGVAYFSLDNHSAEKMSISRVTSPQFGRVEIHETTMDGDVARMRRIEELQLAPGSRTVLQPGGLHLMLMQPAEVGDTVTLRLWSGEALLLSVDATISPAAGDE